MRVGFRYGFQTDFTEQVVIQQGSLGEPSVQIRFQIQNNAVQATDPARTKSYSDRVPTAHSQKKIRATRVHP